MAYPAKSDRNKEMLILWRNGTSIYRIAKRYELSWPRAKRIIQEQEDRDAKKPSTKPL